MLPDANPTPFGRAANRLAGQSSPYLRAHAHDAVDWYPWGEEAFARARERDRPVFLSIGYAACHWCHVMHAESFANEEVARVLNDAFVCVKVDREERPDVDRLYMAVCQMMTGGGGWPLSVFLTYDRKPFFAGTYFPPVSRWDRVGLLDLVPRIREMWAFKRPEVMAAAGDVASELASLGEAPAPRDLAPTLADDVFSYLRQQYDADHGGFGDAPKFPSVPTILFLLERWRRGRDGRPLDMAARTLEAMAAGGVFDHVGGGFHRYATDRAWRVPHFEKMLYDQALGALAYVYAWQATRKEEFRKVAGRTLDYILHDLALPEGCFAAAEDADNDGDEGTFYRWTAEEVRGALGPDDADVFTRVYGPSVDATGDAADNILWVRRPPAGVAAELGVSGAELTTWLENALAVLYQTRGRRPRPARDENVLVDWNGLAVAALAKGGRAFANPAYIAAAARAVSFIEKRLTASDGGLYHRWFEGTAGVPAFLDDYAYLGWGIWELYEATGERRYLERCLEIAFYLNAHFRDNRTGGYFHAGSGNEALLTRAKDAFDNALPSANGVAARNLVRVAAATGDAGILKDCADLFRAFAVAAGETPAAHLTLLSAYELAAGKRFDVVLVGEPRAGAILELRAVLDGAFLPDAVTSYHGGAGDDAVAAYKNGIKVPYTGAAAYVCESAACREPITKAGELREALGIPDDR